MRPLLLLSTVVAGLIVCTTSQAAELRIALIQSRTGPLESYAKQTEIGLRMGLEYVTKGTNTVEERTIKIITKDDQGKPDLFKAALAEAYQRDKVDIAIGTTSSTATLAGLGVAEGNKKILIVESAVDDQITRGTWRYVFRTGRSSMQEAIANAVALGKSGETIATLAQDYEFGRAGVAAFKAALAKIGATPLAGEVYVPADTTDFTVFGKQLFHALKGKPGSKSIWVLWAGAGDPLSTLLGMDPKQYDIKLSTAGNALPALAAYKAFPDMEGATYYYYDFPDNDENKWLVAEHQKRFYAPPDFFVVSGFTAAMAVHAAVSKAKSTDSEELVKAMEGMEFKTPKGTMMIRKEDHQALQSMYHFKVKVDPALAWAVLEKKRELEIEDMDIPRGR
jgi:branched-chain amino acid transport system substrate-binding protein